MLRAFFLCASFIVATPVVAQPRHIAGQKDGISYDYTADLAHDGQLVLRGEYPDSGDRFELSVSPRGHVNGWVGHYSVSYDVPAAVRDEAVAELGAPDHALLADSKRSPLVH